MRNHKLFLVLIVFLSLHLKSNAQEISTDSLFNSAKQLLKEDLRQDAIVTARKILKVKPTHSDALLLIARTLAWEKEYKQSIQLIDSILIIHPNLEEAHELQSTVHYWNKDYYKTVKKSEESLALFPKNKVIGTYAAKALMKLNEYQEAYKLFSPIYNAHSKNEEIKNIYDEIKVGLRKHKILFNSEESYFTSHKSSRVDLSGQYIYKHFFGTHIFKYNHSFFRGNSGNQLEYEGYLKPVRNMYVFANLGFSSSKLFPAIRHGLEPFFKLPNSMEGSIGYRFMRFSSSDVWVYTGSVTKYHKDFWLNLRTFISPKDVGFSQSHIFSIRKYRKNAFNWFGGHIGFGVSPLETNLGADFEKLLFTTSYKIELTDWRMLNKHIQLRSAIFYQYYKTNNPFSILGAHLVVLYKF